jgi:uncharacterized protein YegP (UPF0339 family)
MFNLHATNGEIILTSETYVTKSAAQGGVASVKANAPIDSRYDRRASSSQFYFVLRAANNEVIGTTERYTTKQAMESAGPIGTAYLAANPLIQYRRIALDPAPDRDVVNREVTLGQEDDHVFELPPAEQCWPSSGHDTPYQISSTRICN